MDNGAGMSDTESGAVITLVGCGFVGSIFLDEFLKRAFAGHIPHDIRLIDFDHVDTRNAANQNFLRTDAGRYKAEVLAERVMHSALTPHVVTERLTPTNMKELLKGSLLVIDGVDNLLTRQVLSMYGHLNKVPVLHVGISEMGTGVVEWSHPQHDTFSLAPQRVGAKIIKDPESGVTPPCELARMRGTGVNVGFAAAKAAAIYFGFDAEAHLNGVATNGYLTEWSATPTSHAPVEQTWGRIE
jgi:hypothetical protein